MTGSSRQQYGNDVVRTQGRGHDLIEHPRGFALRFMQHDGLLGADDHDDVLSDAMYGIAKAIESWDADGGVSLRTWCWWKMRHEVAHGRRHRSRFTREDLTDWPAASGEWHPDLTEHGYKQVEDRATLQRWADMAHLTDSQADILAVFAVHTGTIVRHTHLRGDPLMARLRSGLGGEYSTLKGGLSKLRRVAATGRPWVYTSKPPSFASDDIRTAVAG